MNTPAPARRTGRILLVDDDADARDVLRFTLERDGHAVATAADGLGGLEMAREFRPDIAFVDIMMPGIDGYAVASAMRRDLGSSVWLVALTALPERRARSWGAGFHLHLQKPVQPITLREVIETMLQEPPPA